MNAYQQLESEFDNIANLEHILAIVGWDEAVMMPEGGAKSRAKALAFVQSLKHQMLNSEKVSSLIAQVSAADLEDGWQRQNYILMKRQQQFASVVPNKLIEKLSVAQIECEQAWRKLRPQNDWQAFKPLLQNVFDLSYQASQYKADLSGLDIYDQCLDEFSPGCNQTLITPVFEQLKKALPSLIEKIVTKQADDHYLPIEGQYAVETQRLLARELMQVIGFDFNHGRFDVSHHPFCGGVPDDVRITTRFNQTDFTSALMGICHETGHALYEMGLPKQWARQPVGMALGMALHESQSLLIEMQVCRSQSFLQVLVPKVQSCFGTSDNLSYDNLCLHYTRVKPGLIRVDADEVTYPLHVIMRYEIEQALFAGDIQVDDLPQIWHEKMMQYLNLSTRDNYQDGVMQDVHWPCGLFGYFPAYTIGAIIAAQLYRAAVADVPIIPESIGEGNFTPLLTWLGRHIHSQGSRYDMQTLLNKATGQQLSSDDYIAHFQSRYLNRH